MKSTATTALLMALACIALFIAGCTTTTTTTIGNPAPAPAAEPVQAGAVTAAAPAATAAGTTTECPDTYEKGVWDYTWDTRWMGYAGNHDIRTIADGREGEPDSWNGINAPSATELKLSQKCRDVTGTVAFAMDPVCSGTITGTIDGNELSGTWKTEGCEPEDGSSDGKFHLTMAADNKSWTGKLIGTKWLDWCSDCPPNWAGRRV